MQTGEGPSRWLSSGEFAAKVGCSVATITRYVERGELDEAPVRAGAGNWRLFDPADVPRIRTLYRRRKAKQRKRPAKPAPASSGERP